MIHSHLPGWDLVKRLALMSFLLALLFSCFVWLAWAQKPEVENSTGMPAVDPTLRLKIEPLLFKQLIEGDGDRIPVIVEVEATADLAGALAEADPTRRRLAVVATLQATAQSSQAGIQAVLADREALGEVARVRSLWILNALAAEADLDTVLALAARPEVRIVRRDREYRIADQPPTSPAIVPDAQSNGWNIAQIRADRVWYALKIDGTGVVVANIDTGVDWLHPALHTRYRGYDPHGLHIHRCNWFDATTGGASYPVDGHGHGTHTMGTLVGGGGIGVAPGATWIAVRAFDSQGAGLESWLHAAMQWIIDPGPGCIPPHVVNNSWGSSWGGTDVFRADVRAMRAAGIFAPFAAGNDGPDSGSIDAPGSYPEAFSVGAVTNEDVIANFSSRGPSSWYGRNLVKPEISAPGVNVTSSLPGGGYGKSSGTSMATPHVAGVAALMRQADPSVTVDRLETILKETAVSLGNPIPNNNYGWGRVDAYRAAVAVADSGTVTGSVKDMRNGVPLVDATLTAVPSDLGPPVAALTRGDGTYIIALAPDRYALTAAAFGYAASSRAVQVLTNTSNVEDFALAPLPSGVLTGRVTSAGLPLPSTATIAVIGAPVTATTDVGGLYTTYLPAGSYTVTVTSPGHRVVVAANVPIMAGETTVRDFELITAPNILLVDTGAWYYASEIGYYRQALDELRYTYDLWTVNDPARDVPAAKDLLPYDIVFWSSPQDSPGYLNASYALTSYLKSGGSLFLSGQDIAYYDNYYPFISAPYFNTYLKARFVRDNSGVTSVAGLTGSLFDGLAFNIYGPGGADNQASPDEISVLEPDFAASVMGYLGDGSAGQQAGHCLPYRAIYLSYGFEAIASAAVRTEVISRSVAWFTSPPVSAGVELTPGSQSGVGNFGDSVTHTLRIRNLAETGEADIFTLTATDFEWPAIVITDRVSLNPCQSAQSVVVVQVPDTATWAAGDSVTIVAQSTRAPGVSARATGETRAPAPVLLVDDDRWYNVEDHYRNALRANSIPYDEWQVPWSFNGSQPPSPPIKTLQMYPLVLWFSAYDWYQPLTPVEEGRLAQYLEMGGRLYYNGQDYLFSSEGPNDFARTYLGVEDYTEDLTSTTVIGRGGSPIGSFLGPYELTFPYKNFSDALTPTASAEVAFIGQVGQTSAVTNKGPDFEGGRSPWRTAFFAFNPDGLEDTASARLMQRLIGWLSWLGDSSVYADKGLARDGDTLTYTLVLRNDGWEDIATAYITATFPSDLIPLPNSVSGGAAWDAGQSAFVWSGPLLRGQNRTFTYQAAITSPLPEGYMVRHPVQMGYTSHFINFDRIVATRVNQPDLSHSTFKVTPVIGEKGGLLTYTLQVHNTGVTDGMVRASNTLPDSLALLSDTLQASVGLVQANGRVITWSVPVGVGDQAWLTYMAVITGIPPSFLLRNRAILDDGLGNTLSVDAVAAVKGIPLYLPFVLK